MSGTWPNRNGYAASRILNRMKSRGEPMVLRVVSLLPGPEPFRNPPDVSNDITVIASSTTGGQSYVGLSGSNILGRLVAGDQIMIGPAATTVQAMPTNVMTDSDGIPIVDGSGNPTFGTPPVYNADALAWNNTFPVVPVSVPLLLDAGVTGFVFVADTTVYGRQLSYRQMVNLGWVETDTIAVSIAAKGIAAPPKVNDLILLNGGSEVRAVIDTGRTSRDGTEFLYPVNLK